MPVVRAFWHPRPNEDVADKRAEAIKLVMNQMESVAPRCAAERRGS
jgi:hypothetical protein